MPAPIAALLIVLAFVLFCAWIGMGGWVKAINGQMLPEMMVVDLGVAADRDQERASKARRD